MNAELEPAVRQMPGQYHWLHRRFKTRPPGEPDVYGDGRST
jgi:KDO2-lipid IV(A) lauroyltransferase